jgi:hypothetical protein
MGSQEPLRGLLHAPARRASRSLRCWMRSSSSFLAFSASWWSCCSPNCRMRCTNSCVSISSAMLLTAAQQSSTNEYSTQVTTSRDSASVLQDNDTSRMKLLGSQALPGGIEARRSSNCFECSVHAWSKRPPAVSIPGPDSMVLKRRSARSDGGQRQDSRLKTQARGASTKYKAMDLRRLRSGRALQLMFCLFIQSPHTTAPNHNHVSSTTSSRLTVPARSGCHL